MYVHASDGINMEPTSLGTEAKQDPLLQRWFITIEKEGSSPTMTRDLTLPTKKSLEILSVHSFTSLNCPFHEMIFRGIKNLMQNVAGNFERFPGTPVT